MRHRVETICHRSAEGVRANFNEKKTQTQERSNINVKYYGIRFHFFSIFHTNSNGISVFFLPALNYVDEMDLLTRHERNMSFKCNSSLSAKR